MFGAKEQAEKKTKRAVFMTAFFVILFFCILFVTPVAAYNFLYRNKVFLGVSVDGIPFGGLTQESAREKLEGFSSDLDRRGLLFIGKAKEVTLQSTTVAVNDPDFSYSLITVNTDDLTDAAFSVGRNGNWHARLLAQAKAIFVGNDIPLSPSFNDEKLLAALKDNFGDLEKPGTNASLVFHSNSDIEVAPETRGDQFDYEAAIADLKNSTHLLASNPVHLISREFIPSITKDQVEAHLQEVKNFLAHPLVLVHGDQRWELAPEQYREALAFVQNEGKLSLQFDAKKLGMLLEPIAQAIFVEPKDGVLEIDPDGKHVKNFVPSAEGIKLDTDKTVQSINELAFATTPPATIALTIVAAEPKVKTEDISQLGIKELLGVGESQYSGSPVNRRHNIAIGAKTLNGILIPPGETFSLIKTLGSIDATNGYRQELVIKDNKTIPEYGGGLCQIGTTMFRAALKAALPIVERQNHSYRVPYYEPAGTDATIYSPSPDLRFKNDTGHHLLIRTINDPDHSKLYFQVWGTSDGRSETMTDPVVYGITAPPPTKIVETLDLKPGVKKCTERAHNGAKAYFTRTIINADGRTKEERYDSYYKPWQAVCLIGVEKLSDPVAAEVPLSPDQPSADATTTNPNPTTGPVTVTPPPTIP